jgi:hypothetical protein
MELHEWVIVVLAVIDGVLVLGLSFMDKKV